VFTSGLKSGPGHDKPAKRNPHSQLLPSKEADMAKSNYCEHGDDVYSYDTCIRTRDGDRIIQNVTKYSTTTSKHQTQTFQYDSQLAQVEAVTNIPRGASPEVLRQAARDRLTLQK